MIVDVRRGVALRNSSRSFALFYLLSAPVKFGNVPMPNPVPACDERNPFFRIVHLPEMEVAVCVPSSVAPPCTFSSKQGWRRQKTGRRSSSRSRLDVVSQSARRPRDAGWPCGLFARASLCGCALAASARARALALSGLVALRSRRLVPFRHGDNRCAAVFSLPRAMLVNIDVVIQTWR